MSQELEEGKCSYLGRSHRSRVGKDEKSAEVIVVIGNEPSPEDKW
jgi:hypothetical protein